MSEQKIIKLLIENNERTFSINEISKKLKLDYKYIHSKVIKLEKENLIQIQKYGNSKQCSFSNSYSSLVLDVESQRSKNLLKYTNIKAIYDRIDRINNPFYILLIFGSYANEKQTKNSDIDICLITETENISEKIGQIIKTLPLDIHLLNFSVKEFLTMLNTKKRTVADEIINNHIILFGVENYYRLITLAHNEKNTTS